MTHWKAAIFDMDGVLIDSEPLWQEAEITCFREIGVKVTRQLCQETAGYRIDEVIARWHQRFRWETPSPSEMVERVLARVTELILERGTALPGVYRAMQSLADAGLPIAIASSSPPALIEAVVDRLALSPFLTLTHSGLLEARGKPDPAVFLSTASMLGVDPSDCVVFEDAPAGVLAASRAGMHVIAIPSVFDGEDPGFDRANARLQSLEEFSLARGVV